MWQFSLTKSSLSLVYSQISSMLLLCTFVVESCGGCVWSRQYLSYYHHHHSYECIGSSNAYSLFHHIQLLFNKELHLSSCFACCAPHPPDAPQLLDTRTIPCTSREHIKCRQLIISVVRINSIIIGCKLQVGKVCVPLLSTQFIIMGFWYVCMCCTDSLYIVLSAHWHTCIPILVFLHVPWHISRVWEWFL